MKINEKGNYNKGKTKMKINEKGNYNKGETKMKINEHEIIKKLIDESNRNMKPGYAIGRLLSIEEVQSLSPHGLDGAWVVLQRGELSEGDNNLLYEINGAKDLYAMAEVKNFGGECGGVMLYGTIEDLFEGFCRELASIPFGKYN